ncbi:MAG: ABC transporter ATP-binding protein [Candidatus Izemoplasmataceae bacterium]
MEDAIIKTEKLYKTYGERPITNHVDLTIHRSDFTVIMGSSGSGKSTLLYLLSGLETPTSGRVSYGGTNIVSLSEKATAEFRRKRMGFVFQAMHLVPSISVLENLMVPGGLVESDRKSLRSRAIALLEKLGVDAHVDKYPATLSGGEKQRVAIARAMINTPEVLFADEPTGALNSKQGENVLDLLAKLHKEGQSVVMVTHDIKAATRATRIVFLNDGCIDGTLRLPPYEPAKRSQREETIFTFLKQKGW